MKPAAIIRSRSFQAHSQLFLGSSSDPINSISFHRRSLSIPKPTCIHYDTKLSRGQTLPNPLRRSRSDTDLTVSEKIRVVDRTVEVLTEEEEECDGGGMGKGSKFGGGGGGSDGDWSENRKMGDYYQEMLRTDPSNPLLLRNYGKFLHEVEGDVKGAEECYGRAILASPTDGDVLSLYGKLVWETHKDEERATAYFERAVEASPDDCYVMGSYAKFLWDTEDEEEEEGNEEERIVTPSPLLHAFNQRTGTVY